MQLHARLTTAPAVLVSLSLLFLAGCSGGDTGAADGSRSPAAEAEAAAEPSEEPEPETPEEFLGRAEEAMAAEHGWTFAVTGTEGLTLQGQESSASYAATATRTLDPEAFRAQGTVTSKGESRPEQVYLLDGTAYVKEAAQGWKRYGSEEPEAQNKVEDPLRSLDIFQTYVRKSPRAVTLTRQKGKTTLRLRTSARAYPEVADEEFARKALRELEPTLRQLEDAGIPVTRDQLTLSRFEETLTLAPKTYRIVAHRCRLSFAIPYGDQSITYEQDVRETNRGTFGGEIKLPADAT